MISQTRQGESFNGLSQNSCGACWRHAPAWRWRRRPKPPSATTRVFAADQAPENIDPYFNNVRVGVIIGQQVWDTLIYRDPRTQEYKGQLARAWNWTDDKTLEVELRAGIKFHNGEAFDADDVVYTLNFVPGRRTASSPRPTSTGSRRPRRSGS